MSGLAGGILILASNNAHKLDEIREILGPLGVEVSPLSAYPQIPDPPETGDTFEANALQKARFVFARAGLPCVADDSGLSVDALGGRPGVYSKRYSPEATPAANNALLLREMDGVEDRAARFVCAMALVTPAGERVTRGACEGRIGHALRGEGGFGYDPLFWPADTPGRSMAELSPAEKNAISHRGRAFSRLPEWLDAL